MNFYHLMEWLGLYKPKEPAPAMRPWPLESSSKERDDFIAKLHRSMMNANLKGFKVHGINLGHENYELLRSGYPGTYSEKEMNSISYVRAVPVVLSEHEGIVVNFTEKS